MDATALTADSPLPDDVPSLQALVRQLLAEVARLRGQLDAALKHRFGRRSERRRIPPPVPAEKGGPKAAAPHGRSVLPEHLERREVIHDLGEEQKLCPCCGEPRVCIGEQSAEQLEIQPAVFYILRTVKEAATPAGALRPCSKCQPSKSHPDRFGHSKSGR